MYYALRFIYISIKETLLMDIFHNVIQLHTNSGFERMRQQRAAEFERVNDHF